MSLQFMSRATARVAAGLGVVAALVPAAFAQAADVSVAVAGAANTTMAAPTFGDFAGITLNGSAQDTTATVSNWTATDATGTGAGWSVNINADVPHTADNTKTLAGATMTLTAPTVAPVDTSNAATAPVVNGGDIIGGGVAVVNAALGTGQGAWGFTQPANSLTLKVPANALAASYTSTITTTLGPKV